MSVYGKATYRAACRISSGDGNWQPIGETGSHPFTPPSVRSLWPTSVERDDLAFWPRPTIDNAPRRNFGYFRALLKRIPPFPVDSRDPKPAARVTSFVSILPAGRASLHAGVGDLPDGTVTAEGQGP